MKYTMRGTVAVHDTDFRGVARPSVIWRYMQEAANRQMRDEGPSYDELLSRGLSFLLSRMAMVSYLPLRQYQPIVTETWACAGQGLSFDRAYRILTEDGRIAAEGIGVWALLDLETKRLRRVCEIDLGYGTDAPLTLPCPTRFRIPRTLSPEPVGERVIRYSEIDVNGHMNNTNYPDMICDFLPEPGEGYVGSVSISFLREAPLGTALSVFRCEDAPENGRRQFYFETKRDGEVNVQAAVTLLPEIPDGGNS